MVRYFICFGLAFQFLNFAVANEPVGPAPGDSGYLESETTLADWLKELNLSIGAAVTGGDEDITQNGVELGSRSFGKVSVQLDFAIEGSRNPKSRDDLLPIRLKLAYDDRVGEWYLDQFLISAVSSVSDESGFTWRWLSLDVSEFDNLRVVNMNGDEKTAHALNWSLVNVKWEGSLPFAKGGKAGMYAQVEAEVGTKMAAAGRLGLAWGKDARLSVGSKWMDLNNVDGWDDGVVQSDSNLAVDFDVDQIFTSTDSVKANISVGTTTVDGRTDGTSGTIPGQHIERENKHVRATINYNF